jgi:hypothetical protein
VELGGIGVFERHQGIVCPVRPDVKAQIVNRVYNMS